MPETTRAQLPSTIEAIITWVKQQGVQHQARSGVTGWIVSGLVAAVAFVGVAILYYHSWRQGAALAKLQHEKDVQAQEAKRAAVAQAVAKNEVDAAQQRAAVNEAVKKIQAIDATMKATDDKKARTIDEIDNLKSWRDVDRYVGSLPKQPPSSG